MTYGKVWRSRPTDRHSTSKRLLPPSHAVRSQRSAAAAAAATASCSSQRKVQKCAVRFACPSKPLPESSSTSLQRVNTLQLCLYIRPPGPSPSCVPSRNSPNIYRSENKRAEQDTFSAQHALCERLRRSMTQCRLATPQLLNRFLSNFVPEVLACRPACVTYIKEREKFGLTN